MSGVVTPVHVIVEPFGKNAALLLPTDPGGATLPVPVPSQIGVNPAAASFDDGFPPATMVDPETSGGVPPFGQDMTGILYMLSAYCSMLQAGQRASWNAVASAAFVGYKIGARVASITTPGRVFENILDGNIANPDLDMTGWAALDPLTAVSAPAAGTIHNLALPGASDYALDINTAAGNVDISGFVAQRNGQRIYLSNTGANLLQALANNVGSVAANRVRAATDLAVIQNQTLTLEWFSGLSRWLIV